LTKKIIYLYSSAAIAGIGLSTLFAPLNLWYIAGFVFVPYLIVLFAKPNKFRTVEVFISGCLVGIFGGCIILSWLYKFRAPGAIIVYIYGALSVGIVMLFVWWLIKRGIFMPLAFCSGWLLLETFFAFCNVHWVLLGYAWTHCEPLVQIADITGVYGISVLILLLNAVIAECMLCKPHFQVQKFKDKRAITTLAITLILITDTFIYGKTKIVKLSREKPEKHLNILGIQANVVNKNLSVSNSMEKTMKKYTDLTFEAIGIKMEGRCPQRPNSGKDIFRENKVAEDGDPPVDLIVWPEGALPDLCFFSDDIARQAGALAYELETPIMTGFLRKVIKNKQEKTFNSVIIAYPEVEMSKTYDKQGLIPLAENTRFKKYFKKIPFLKKLIKRNVTPGTNFMNFTVKIYDGKNVKIAPLVCYEDALSRIAVGMAKKGAEIFVNLTNDGNFPNPKAAWQHQNIAKLRTIETRRPLFRATNTGVTCLIDRCGRKTKILKNKGKATFVEGFLKVKAGIYKTKQTFYMQHGNWLLKANLLVGAICIILTTKDTKNSKNRTTNITLKCNPSL